jgi:hypothetical protein
VKKSNNPPLSAAQAEALQARFALRVSARLDDSAKALPHDITERLRVAREQAVRAALQARPQTVAAPQFVPAHQLAGVSLAGSGGSGQATLSGWGGGMSRHERDSARGRRLDDGPLPWGWRLASTLPAVALVLGLWGIHHWYRSEQVQAATDVDMALLTDDLPPAAYADPGFEEYLRTEAPTSAQPPVEAVAEAAPSADADDESEEDSTDGEPRSEEAQARP